MGAHTRNPAASDGEAQDRLAWRLNEPDLSVKRRALRDTACVDELMCRLSDPLRSGRLDEWQTTFPKSMLCQARRGGRRLMPSPKQLAIMEDIAEGRPNESEESLIEEEGGDDWPF